MPQSPFDLMTQFGTSIEDTKKLIAGLKPYKEQAVADFEAQKQIQAKIAEIKTKPVTVMPAFQAKALGFNIPDLGPDSDQWKIKFLADAKDPQGFKVSFISPTGWEQTQDGLFISPVSEGSKTYTRDQINQIIQQEKDQQAQFEKTRSIFGKVFPGGDMAAIKAFADADDTGFKQWIFQAGDNDDTRFIMKKVYQITDAQLDAFFNPAQVTPPGSVVSPSEEGAAVETAPSIPVIIPAEGFTTQARTQQGQVVDLWINQDFQVWVGNETEPTYWYNHETDGFEALTETTEGLTPEQRVQKFDVSQGRTPLQTPVAPAKEQQPKPMQLAIQNNRIGTIDPKTGAFTPIDASKLQGGPVTPQPQVMPPQGPPGLTMPFQGQPEEQRAEGAAFTQATGQQLLGELAPTFMQAVGAAGAVFEDITEDIASLLWAGQKITGRFAAISLIPKPAADWLAEKGLLTKRPEEPVDKPLFQEGVPLVDQYRQAKEAGEIDPALVWLYENIPLFAADPDGFRVAIKPLIPAVKTALKTTGKAIGQAGREMATGIPSALETMEKGGLKPITFNVAGGKGAIGKGTVKEPWQLSLLEYGKSKLPLSQRANIIDPKQVKSFSSQHIKEIRGALERGENVPADVLLEYRGTSWADEVLSKAIKPIKPAEAVSVKAIPEVKPPVKEPWQMTREEIYDKAKELLTPGAEGKPFTAERTNLLNKQVDYHKTLVKQALSEGKPVPPEVLKDYPDLAKGIKPPVKEPLPVPEVKPPVQEVKPPPRKPLWADMEDARIKPAEVEPPIPGQTPSGRKPGGPGNIKSEPPIDNYQRVVDSLTPPPNPKFETKKNAFLRAMYDRNWELQALEKASGIPAHKLAQVVPGATASGEDLLRRFVRPITKLIGKDLNHLEEYMVLMRSQDILVRNTSARLPGGVQGHGGIQQALSVLEKKIGSGRFKAVKDTADKLWKLNDELVLNPLKEEGILNSKSYTAIKSSNPHYIPFQRADFADYFTAGFSRPEASVSSTGIEKLILEGSERILDNPLARFEAQVIKTQYIIARNKAAKGIVAALQEVEKTTGQKLVTKAGAKAEHSIITDTVSFYRDGIKETIQVPSIYGQIARGLEAESGNILNTILGAMSAPLRLGAVTYNPAFLIVNPLRDATSAFFREKLIPLSPDYIKGWISVIRKDATFSEAANSGALLSGIVDTMRSTEALKRVQMGGIQVKNAKDALLLIPRLIEHANITAEQATRVATFRKLRMQGVDALEAAVRSRDVTVDFAKSGNVMKVINQVLPFSNAALQGSVNVGRTMRSNPKWALVAGGAFVIPTVLSRVNNMRFETSKLIPDYEYTNNWVIQVAEGERKDKTKFPIYVKIPKGSIGSMLTFPGEALFNLSQYDNNRSAVETILNAGIQAGKTTLPVDPSVSGILPPVLRTGAGLATKQNIYAGQPIIPRREGQLLPEQQFGPETSEFATLVGKQFKVSPRLIEFAISDYTAGTGQAGLWLLDLGLDAIGYKPDVFKGIEQPELSGAEQVSKIPVVKRFMGTKGTQEERSGWENFNKVSEDTNREFNKLPDMNRLGIRLGEVTDTINKVELTPQERAEYQQIMADSVIQGLKKFDWATIPDEDKAEAIKAKITELKGQAKVEYMQLAKLPVPEKEPGPVKVTLAPELKKAVDDYSKLQARYGRNSPQAQLALIDDPELFAYIQSIEKIDPVVLPRDFLEKAVKFTQNDRSYNAMEAENRKDYLERHPDYARFRLEKVARGLFLPDEQIENYVDWRLAETAYDKQILLKENPDFYKAGLEKNLFKEIDLAKVPSREVKSMLDDLEVKSSTNALWQKVIDNPPSKDVLSFWKQYKKLPTWGDAREIARAKNPEGNAYLEDVIGIKPLTDEQKKKFAYEWTPELSTAKKTWEKASQISDTEGDIYLILNPSLEKALVDSGIKTKLDAKERAKLTPLSNNPALRTRFNAWSDAHKKGRSNSEAVKESVWSDKELYDYLVKHDFIAPMTEKEKRIWTPLMGKPGLKAKYDIYRDMSTTGTKREEYILANQDLYDYLVKSEQIDRLTPKQEAAALNPDTPDMDATLREYQKIPSWDTKKRQEYRRKNPAFDRWYMAEFGVKPLGIEIAPSHPLYTEYLKLPLGSARTEYRKNHPELEKWGVDNRKWAPLPDTTKDHPLYTEYLKLPLGSARTNFRRNNPELEAWGVENKKWAPLSTGRRSTRRRINLSSGSSKLRSG